MIKVSWAEIYKAPGLLYQHRLARRLSSWHRDCFFLCTDWKSHVGEKHNHCSGNGSMGESRSLMAEVNKGTTSWDKPRSPQKAQAAWAEGEARLWNEAESIFHSLPPLSICLSLPFSLSLCLFSLCKPSAANFHLTHLRTNSNTSLSLCQDILLANLPHPLAMCVFYSTDCLPDNSQTWWFALTSLCVQSAHVTEGLQRMQGTSSAAGQPCNSSVRLRHRGLARRDGGSINFPCYWLPAVSIWIQLPGPLNRTRVTLLQVERVCQTQILTIPILINAN